jgi:hypothetical protein
MTNMTKMKTQILKIVVRSFTTFTFGKENEMEIDDLPKLCAGLYGCNEHSDWRKIKAAKKIYSELFNACVENRGPIGYKKFREVVLHHGTFMFPVFDLQRVMRKKVIVHLSIRTLLDVPALELTLECVQAFGNRYWDNLPVEKLSPKAKHYTRQFDRRP